VTLGVRAGQAAGAAGRASPAAGAARQAEAALFDRRRSVFLDEMGVLRLRHINNVTQGKQTNHRRVTGVPTRR
jgi:hypothetical protein